MIYPTEVHFILQFDELEPNLHNECDRVARLYAQLPFHPVRS